MRCSRDCPTSNLLARARSCKPLIVGCQLWLVAEPSGCRGNISIGCNTTNWCEEVALTQAPPPRRASQQVAPSGDELIQRRRRDAGDPQLSLALHLPPRISLSPAASVISVPGRHPNRRRRRSARPPICWWSLQLFMKSFARSAQQVATFKQPIVRLTMSRMKKSHFLTDENGRNGGLSSRSDAKLESRESRVRARASGVCTHTHTLTRKESVASRFAC